MRFTGFAAAVSAFVVMSCVAADAATMTFRTVNIGDCRTSCRKALLAEGEIVSKSDIAFQRAFGKAGRPRTVLLNSPGGNILGSLKLGFAFREAKVEVSIKPGGSCYSACAYALFGGVERSVPDDARFGMHGFADMRTKVPERDTFYDKDIYGLLREYAKEMGVSPAVIAMAEDTPSGDMRILTPAELKKTRVVTRR